MAGFIVGLLVGGFIGVLVMCLFVEGSDGEGGGRDEH
jgi:hypothetical protein